MHASGRYEAKHPKPFGLPNGRLLHQCVIIAFTVAYY